MNTIRKIISICLAFGIIFTSTSCRQSETNISTVFSTNSESVSEVKTTVFETDTIATSPISEFSLNDIEDFSGEPYAIVNGNIPYFDDSDMTTDSFETYSALDALGRCGTAYACIGKDIMPVEERGQIGNIKPSGWHTVKYDNVDGKYLYNRCHLIGYQLAGENANENNLITGTRYLNTIGMLPFENMIAEYVNETNNHVLYRVTPIFEGDNLLASGVLMEGFSIEDNGNGICFNIFCYNVQPDISINYSNGDRSLSYISSEKATESGNPNYVLNTNTKKFHYPYCSCVDNIKNSNKQEYEGSKYDLITQGYESCKVCNP